MTTTTDTRAKDQALAQFRSIAEMVTAYKAAQEVDDNGDAADEARTAIEEDALCVEVRSDWHSPGAADDSGPSEFMILLCTGGPAVRLVGTLDRCEPDTVRIEYQDWFTPWTAVHPSDLPEGDDETLLAYARCFYFGD